MAISTSLTEYLIAIPDKRRGEGLRHDQTFIILIVIMSAMSGYYGYRATGDFVKRNKEDLLKYFEPEKSRLPSFYTIRRVIQNLDFTILSKQFHQWAMQYIDLPEAEWVSIDGKAISGTVTDYNDGKQRFINLVSLYCSKQKLVIGNASVDSSKTNETPVVRQLIEALDIKGVTFTLDALHCQKKLGRSLSRVGIYYVIGVKKNQQLLHRDIERIMAKEENVSSKYTDIEQSKGRKELRTVWVSDCLEGINEEWIGLKQIIKVSRIIKKKQEHKETAYFISSLNGLATFYNEGIRVHWSIENSLHWVKDVTFNEDASKIRTGNAPENISTIRNIALNVFRTNDYNNMEEAIRLVCNDIGMLKKMII